jgi:hypothetical protein
MAVQLSQHPAATVRDQIQRRILLDAESPGPVAAALPKYVTDSGSDLLWQMDLANLVLFRPSLSTLQLSDGGRSRSYRLGRAGGASREPSLLLAHTAHGGKNTMPGLTPRSIRLVDPSPSPRLPGAYDQDGKRPGMV